jgi:DNA helicase-2/ATP-dependent DNA helicase PcrA
MIAEYPDHFLHLGEMKQMTDIEQESLIRKIISESRFSDLRPLGKPDAYVSTIIRSIDETKREALTPEMVIAHAEAEIERISKDEDSISTRGATKGLLKADAREAIEKCKRTKLFAGVYELYEKEKREMKKMDFNDLIIEILTAFRNDELLLRLIQERFLYIHVDEHQDTNDAQNFIVALIAEFFETPNVFIVGDEKQAIYRFQGASVENFLRMQKRWPAMELISLDTNYRSHQSILDASYAMIEHNYGDEKEHAELRIRLESGLDETARPIEIVTGENVAAAELYMVKELQNLTEKEPEASVAIIVRRNRDLDRVIRLLESNNVPVSSERSVDIFNHPIGSLFFELITYLADSTRIDALAKTVMMGLWDISFEEGALFVRKLSSGQSGEISDKIPAITRLRSRLMSDGAVAFLIHLAEESGFIKLVATDPSYVHVWRGIVALAESLTRESEIRDPMKLMHDMLAYRTSAETRTVKVAVGAPHVAIQAMTAHGSKGLEFDYVFIPYANEEGWVGRSRGNSFVLPKKQTVDSDIRDIRRLFYVAVTRARKHVVILPALEESDGKILTPIRFISELDEKHVVTATLPRIGIESIHTAIEDQTGAHSAEIAIQKKLIDMTKHVLVEKGLSVTALNHFLTCPNRFLYQSILKLPQAPSVPAEKGNAMHSAIARVWNSESRQESGATSRIESTLTEAVAEYMSESLLPVLEKDAVKKELFDSIPDVARELTPHFHVSTSTMGIFVESWAETLFTGSYEKTPIHIPLHGKLDAVIDTGSSVQVFDYKTRQAMSVNAIMGETKSSDGSYFRQLIYYQMLLQNDIRWKGKKIVPSLVFVSPDEKGRCPIVSLPIQETDIARVKDEIQKLIESVWSGAIARTKCDDQKCEWCPMRSL